MKNKKNMIKHHYTVVELLVVLVIAGLLAGMTVSGIKGALARQGATGAVRTLASKVSLAQSFAVSRNRYVALLVPDYNEVVINPKDSLYSISTKTEAGSWNNYSSCFVKNRLCYITKDSSSSPAVYKFDRWVDGYEWQTLPSKTVAFISEKAIGAENIKSTPIQVIDVPDPTDPNASPAFVKSTALVFKPSGALINANRIVIRIFRAAYLPYDGTDGAKAFRWQGTGDGKEDENKGWQIVINGFTGRSRFYMGDEIVND